MRKKVALLGMKSPDETPGICETKIQITQPTGKAGPPEPGGGSPSGSKPGSSEWFVRIDEVAKEFEGYRTGSVEPLLSRIHRERFYQGVWELAAGWSKYKLRIINWKGDVTQDAMDITADLCGTLLKQEEEGRGIFASVARTPAQTRGYLSQTIRLGVAEQVREMSRKRKNWVGCSEKSAANLMDSRHADWLPQVRRLARAVGQVRKRVRNIRPSDIGCTPLEFVMDLALDRKIEVAGLGALVRLDSLTKRTRQRRESTFRRELRRELEI